MMKTISFGKHAIASKRKINAVEVELRLYEKEPGKPVFSACANAWNNLHSGIVGGQCLDTLAELSPELRRNPLYREIIGLWRRNHLNDMHAGTERQEHEIQCWLASTGKKWNYDEVCQHLKEVGLYEDDGYKYGTGWLYREINPSDLKRIRELMA